MVKVWFLKFHNFFAYLAVVVRFISGFKIFRASKLHPLVNWIIGTKYSTVEKIFFLEDSLLKIWNLKVAEADHIHSNFLKAVFHKIYLAHSFEYCVSNDHWKAAVQHYKNKEITWCKINWKLQRKKPGRLGGMPLVTLLFPWNTLHPPNRAGALLHELSSTNCTL